MNRELDFFDDEHEREFWVAIVKSRLAIDDGSPVGAAVLMADVAVKAFRLRNCLKRTEKPTNRAVGL